MSKAYIGIGSNMGDKKDNINNAINLLKEKCTVIKVSTLIKTAPEGYTDQPDFLNGAIEVDTSLTPKELMDFLLNIENSLGRKRTIKNGPRIIDLDILLYEDKIINDTLEIPHPRMHERKFVLIPLKEIAPNVIHPILKKSIKDL